MKKENRRLPEYGVPQIAPFAREERKCADMKKISFPPGNAFCPACLYLYGTYREDGQPNYGLFTWAAYAWDEGLRFVACIGEDKLTRDRIRAQGVFSASVVSEALLPAAK